MIYELSEKEVEALRRVISYLIESKADHYYSADKATKKTHIFRDVLTLSKLPFVLNHREGEEL